MFDNFSFTYLVYAFLIIGFVSIMISRFEIGLFYGIATFAMVVLHLANVIEDKK